MKVLVSGATGFIGRALCSALKTNGHQVASLVRRRGSGSNDEVFWDPTQGQIELDKLNNLDAVIHLAGEPVVGRWSERKKAAIYDSRVQGTQLLVDSLKKLQNPPSIFLSASAIGFYGDTGFKCVDEASPQGEGFLAHVSADWEAASAPLAASGMRVAHMRIGLVLSPKGGALQRMLPPFKFGLGGILGSGKQAMSWIALDDLVAAFLYVLSNEALDGPFNLVAPQAVSNYEFTKTLGRVLRRPTFFPVPAFVLKFLLGEMAESLFLGSSCVRPTRLIKAGFSFKYPKLDAALEHLLC